MRNIFFKLFNLIIFFLIISFHNLLADDHDPIKNLEKVIGSTFKTLSTKSLNKEDTKNFVLNYAIKDDKQGYIKYLFDLENVQGGNIASHGKYFIYDNFTIIKQGRWKMNMRGIIFLDGDKKNSMRFHLKQKEYQDNNLAVKIKNDNYPKGKFFNIDLILKDQFYFDLSNIKD